MQVKKINSDWKPSENTALKVGEIIEITDPKDLILRGCVVAVNEKGQELSPYDLYGKITKDEFSEFKAWRELEQAKSMKKNLEQEQEQLKKKIEPEEGSDNLSESTNESTKKTLVDASMPWKELQAKGKELDVYHVGINKVNLIKAINEA